MKRPFLLLVLPYCAGIALAGYIKLSVGVSFIAAAAFLVLALSLVNRRLMSYLSLFPALVLIGASHLNLVNTIPAASIANAVGNGPVRILVRGVIKDGPVAREGSYGRSYYDFLIDARSYYSKDGWREIKGTVKVILPGDSFKPRYGDRVLMQGILARPRGLKNPGLFDYERYLARNGIYAVLYAKSCAKDNKTKISVSPVTAVKRTAYFVRDKISGSMDRAFPNDIRTAGFLKAILIGDRSSLDRNDNESFVKTGTVHIVSISGTHIALIAGLALFVFSYAGISRRTSFILASASIIFYSFVAGLNPPIVRSAVMFGVLAVGYVIERDADIVNTLCLAALVILIHNPNVLYDPGFQLSFLSVAGIIILLPKFDNIFHTGTIKRTGLFGKARFYLAKGLGVSLAAWLATMPLVLYHYSIISPSAILANLVIIPFASLIMICGIALAGVSSIAPFIAGHLAAPVSVLYGIMLFVNRMIAALPYAFLTIGRPAQLFIAAYYLLLGVFMMPAEINFKYFNLKRGYLLILALILFNLSAWRDVLQSGLNPAVKATFLDVGRGDSAVLELKDGAVIVIDAGSAGSFDMGRGVVAPFLRARGIRKIDALIITHSHEDHAGGSAYILANFDVGCVIDYGMVRPGRKGVSHHVVRAGNFIDIGGGRFYVLNPERDRELSDPNDDSLVMKFVYRDFTVLFGGDIKEAAMSRVLKYGSFLEADVMKVPHHGGRIEDANVFRKFFEAVKAKDFVISSGRMIEGDNQAIIENYIIAYKSNIYNTYMNGGIGLCYDGDAYKIVVQN